ncbi:L,D-transpeptidase family protein [Litchfieldella rifensis]|uniref:L,D-transpeptidase family protein n=1 Tax=Litchfieldella rifensis TaxID=762643 RepID=A0ABV7LLH6_9GAMM
MTMAAMLLSLSPALHADDSKLPTGHYYLPENGEVIGEVKTVIAEKDDTLIDIGRRHGLGFEEMQRANPELGMWYPGEGAEVVVPARFILPPGPREGLVVNLSELRLYYYPPTPEGERPIVETYPISVGREGFATPQGTFKTTMKVKDPAWSPPQSMREEAAARGEPAPTVVPPGPDNPLGRHAILLNIPSYLIHGTNRPDGVGMRVSRGCIRMLPEDIESLYERVPNGTQVTLINEPFKAGWDEDDLYVQSYPLLGEKEGSVEPLIDALQVLADVLGDRNPPVDYARVREAVELPTGRLQAVLRDPTPEAKPVDIYRELDTEATVELAHRIETIS